MFIIVHYSQNTFTVLKVSNFTIFYQKKYILNFWKGTNYKSPCGIRARDFEIRSKRSHPLRYAVWYKFIWGGIIKIMLDFIVYFYRKYVNMEVSHNIRMHGVRIVFPS